jgi:hypothetical protein
MPIDFKVLERLISNHEQVFADQLSPLKPLIFDNNYDARPKNPRKRKNKISKAEKEYFNDKRMAMTQNT